MKKFITVLTAALLFAAAGCSSGAKTVSGSEQPETEQEEVSENTAAEETEAEQESEAETPAGEAHAETLVAFFSATGTTKGVAEKIASLTGADLYEIMAAQPYTAEDLNYNDDNSRTSKEQNDKSVRPEIGSEEISLEGYTTVYLGFPIWWGEEPRILDAFVEKYSFDGITVIPFCTSGSSGIGRSGENMEALAGSGTWLEGRRFDGSVSEEELQTWIDGLQ
ncbi:MAG: flavodoxin [Solobacterium sp.]|nr:flavodoxin [Solobacterium sp.]